MAFAAPRTLTGRPVGMRAFESELQDETRALGGKEMGGKKIGEAAGNHHSPLADAGAGGPNKKSTIARSRHQSRDGIHGSGGGRRAVADDDRGSRPMTATGHPGRHTRSIRYY